jgi:hypothetical protein
MARAAGAVEVLVVAGAAAEGKARLPGLTLLPAPLQQRVPTLARKPTGAGAAKRRYC